MVKNMLGKIALSITKSRSKIYKPKSYDKAVNDEMQICR